MVLFVGAGAMSLVWAVGIALVVLVEKVRPEGIAFGQIAGALLIAAAVIVFARPDLVTSFGGPMRRSRKMAETKAPAWNMKGTLIIACNCEYGCPWNVNGR